MSAQHTPGRLKVGRKVARAIYTDAGHPVCMVDTMGEIQGDEVDQEFARRLVACWNALKDLPQAALDGGWTHAGLEAHALKMEQQARQMQEQRDELLEALKEVFELYVPTKDINSVAASARAAIAKVEGSAA